MSKLKTVRAILPLLGLLVALLTSTQPAFAFRNPKDHPLHPCWTQGPGGYPNAAAAACYRRFAEGGDKPEYYGHCIVQQAQERLGWMHEHGHGVKQDYEKAVAWYHKAAEAGYGNAQFNLARMYERGLGVPQNDAEAYTWFALAAAQAEKEAGEHRDIVARRLTPQGLYRAQVRAVELQGGVCWVKESPRHKYRLPDPRSK